MTSTPVRALVAAAVLLLVACGDGDPGQWTSPADPGAAPHEVSFSAAGTPPAPRTEAQPRAAAPLPALRHELAWRLYASLPQGRGNLILGTHSIQSVLAALSSGADGQTAADLAELAGAGGEAKRLAPAWGSLRTSLLDPSRGGSVQAPGRAWFQKGYPFRPDFLDGLASSGSSSVPADFREGIYDAGSTISRWLQEQGGAWVTSWMAHPSDDAFTQVVLAEALRVRGVWTRPFSAVPGGGFELADGLRIRTPVMEQSSLLRSGEGEKYKAFELPTDREALSVLVIVPEAGAFEQVEASLTGEWISTVAQLLVPRETRLVLPSIALTAATSLSASLGRLGAAAAFEPGRADFSRIDGGRTHYVGAVDHQVAVSLTERGFEFSSVCVAELDGSKEALGPGRSEPGFQVVALGAKPERVVAPAAGELAVARPFFFVLRDARTGGVLFLGRVTDPTA